VAQNITVSQTEKTDTFAPLRLDRLARGALCRHHACIHLRNLLDLQSGTDAIGCWDAGLLSRSVSGQPSCAEQHKNEHEPDKHEAYRDQIALDAAHDAQAIDVVPARHQWTPGI